MEVNDYAAELIVAGRFAEAGWNVYFPHRDKGFDFIVTKFIEGFGELVRPVQVKGKYPTGDKTDKNTYGYVGKLTSLHDEMVLAMPYFSTKSSSVPTFIGYLPIFQIKECSRGYKCEPALFKNGNPLIRPYFKKYFDKEGLEYLNKLEWKNSQIDNKESVIK